MTGAKTPSKLIIDLPNELLDLIADHLTLKETLILRRCHKQLNIAYEKYTRLYLHPTRIKNTIELFDEASMFPLGAVREVVVLGVSLPQMRAATSTPGPLRYRGWPQFDTPASGMPPTSLRELPVADAKKFSECYPLLLAALQRLPNLARLLYAGEATGPGICAVSSADLLDHHRETEERVHNIVTSDQGSTRLPRLTVWWSDTEIIYGLIATGLFNFTAVELLQPAPPTYIRHEKLHHILPPSEPGTDDEGQPLEPLNTFEIAMDKVEELVLTGPGNGTHIFDFLVDDANEVRKIIFHSKTMIDKHWRARADSTFASRGFVDWSSDNISGPIILALREDCLAALEVLEIHGCSTIPDSLSSRSFISALQSREEKLKSVILRNMFFSHKSDVKRGMRDVVEFLKDNVTKAELSVPSLGADHSYPQTNLSNVQLAQRYRDIKGVWFGRQVFSDLAQELGVVESNGWWNFADNTTAQQNGNVEVGEG